MTITGAEKEFAATKSDELIALDDALKRLEKLDPQQSLIVDLKFFSGLPIETIAEQLGISESTVKREWRAAKVWLKGQIATRPR